MDNDKKIIPGQLYQYKSNCFGKCVGVDYIRKKMQYENASYIGYENIQKTNNEPISIFHPETMSGDIQKLYFDLIGPIQNWAERRLVEPPKVVLLALREKIIQLKSKSNPNLIIKEKIYCEVQAVNPISGIPFPNKLWVLSSWIEPLTDKTYYDKFVDEFKDNIKKMREQK